VTNNIATDIKARTRTYKDCFDNIFRMVTHFQRTDLLCRGK